MGNYLDSLPFMAGEPIMSLTSNKQIKETLKDKPKGVGVKSM